MKIKILIIDTGFNTENKISEIIKFTAIHISDDYTIDNDITDINGHGTSIVDLYSRLCPNAEYIILKAFESETITEEKLLFVLRYVSEHIDCDIISLSGGVLNIENRRVMESVCEKLVRQKKYIVAAFDNNGAITFPAALSSVIGVDWTKSIKNVNDFEFTEDSVVNIRGGALHHTLLSANGEKTTVAGSSFVVPYIVKRLKMILENNICDNFNDLLQELKNQAKCVYKVKGSKKVPAPFHIEKAVIFPFIKEVETLARNIDQVSFDILDFFDFKHLRKVGKHLNDLLQIPTAGEYQIKDIETLDWSSPFDTFILGHTDQITNIIGTEYIGKIINNCIHYHKNLFLFDKEHILEEIIAQFHENNLKVYYPYVEKANVPFQWLSKLYMPSKPSIGIFGTSSKQGKFSLLLKLRKLFTDNGFQVGAIGTEPTSPLFGLDKTFPIGYNAFNTLHSLDSISIINYFLYEIEQNNPDIILFASQAHTIAPVNYSLSNVPADQQNLLYAIRPDICILCVNSYDEFNYVKNTIAYLKSLGNSTILGIVISPVPENAQWWRDESYTRHLQPNLQVDPKIKFEPLGIHVYDFDEKDLQALYDACIQYLT